MLATKTFAVSVIENRGEWRMTAARGPRTNSARDRSPVFAIAVPLGGSDDGPSMWKEADRRGPDDQAAELGTPNLARASSRGWVSSF